MKQRQEALNAVVGKDPDVVHYVSFIGASGRGGAGNTGNVFIELKDKPERKVDERRGHRPPAPEAREGRRDQLYLQSAQDVRVGGRSSRTQYQYTLAERGPRRAQRLGAEGPRGAAEAPRAQGRHHRPADERPPARRRHRPRHRLAARGSRAANIDNTLYDAYGQAFVATFYTQINQYHVVLEVKPAVRRSPESLDDIYVKTPAGTPVPLSAIAKTSTSTTALSVNHQGQFPSVTISFNLAPDASLGQAVDAINAAEREIMLPAERARELLRAPRRPSPTRSRASRCSILFALITVYIVLGMLYESYIHPITILSTLPSAGVGALLALLVFKTEFSIIALIGIILLIGIVKKNAIMMIDFAIEAERDEGMSPDEAMRHACVLRFRPIMMTTMAALLGGVPLAIGGGTGSELRTPLGITIVGGLLFSQMLTLFTTPVVYLLMDRFTKRQRSPRKSKPRHLGPAEGAPAE